MTGTERELLTEILLHPEDDAPRLVLADLLTAAGDPHGEVMTLQCRAAAEPTHPDAPAWSDRAEVLLTGTASLFRARLAVGAGLRFTNDPVQVHWARGLPALVSGPQTGLLQATAVPGVQTLRIGGAQNARTVAMAAAHRDRPPGLDAGILRYVDRLELSTAVSQDPLGSAGFAALAELPLRVTRLQMRSRVGVDGFVAFGRSPWLGGLQELSCNDVHPGPAARGLKAILPGFTSLRVLELASCNLDDKAAATLRLLPGTVTTLRLRSNRELGAGILSLCAAGLAGIERLELDYTAVDLATLTALLDGLPGLRVLTARKHAAVATGPQHAGHWGGVDPLKPAVEGVRSHPRVRSGEVAVTVGPTAQTGP